MTIDIYEIFEKFKRLQYKYHETDPFRLCRDMGIIINYAELGSCKGFILTSHRKKVITLNTNLDEDLSRIVLAHELGHACLHLNKQIYTFTESGILESTNSKELEANIFAAELLIDDDDILPLLNEEGYTFFTIAKILHVPYELLDFKLRSLKEKGYATPEIPIYSSSDFMKKDLYDEDRGF